MKRVKLIADLEMESLYSEDEKTKNLNHIISDYVDASTRASPAPACSICYKSTLFGARYTGKIVYVLRTELLELEGCCNRCCMFIITLTDYHPLH